MNRFRKYHFLSVTFLLFTFLSFSRYSIQVLPITGQEANKDDIRFTLVHSISSEFLLPGIERVQSIHIFPVLKYYSEGYTYSALQKASPLSEGLNNVPIVCTASNSILLEQICKLQI